MLFLFRLERNGNKGVDFGLYIVMDQTGLKFQIFNKAVAKKIYLTNHKYLFKATNTKPGTEKYISVGYCIFLEPIAIVFFLITTI